MNNIYNYLIYFFIIDFVVGGAGRYIEVGPLSIRMLLIGLTTILGVVTIVKKKAITRDINYLFLIIMMVILIISLVNGIFIQQNNFGQSISKFISYMSFLSLPFFLETINSKEKAKKYYYFFEKTVLFLSIVTITLFLFLTFNNDLYSPITGVLSKYSIGMVSITNGMGRVFMTGCIFIPIAFTSKIIMFINNVSCKKEFHIIKEIIEILVMIMAIFATVTMGVWLATAAGIILTTIIFIIKRINFQQIDIKNINFQKLLKYLSASLFILFLLYVLGVFDIITDRLSFTDISFATKMQQITETLSMISSNPIFGLGLGTEITTTTSFSTITSVNIELMWFEFLVNTGVFGLTGYLFFILFNVFSGWKIYLSDKEPLTIGVSIGLILLIIINFSNPYLNNPIGINYFIFSIAILGNFKTREYIKYRG